MRAPALSTAALVFSAALIATACGTPPATNGSAGAGVCAGLTAPKQLASLKGPPGPMDLKDGRLALSWTQVVEGYGEVIVVDLADGTVRTLGTARLHPDNVALGPTYAYWMDGGQDGSEASAGIVRAPLDGSGGVDPVLPGFGAGFNMVHDGAALYFASTEDPSYSIFALATDAREPTKIIGGLAGYPFLAGDADDIYWGDCEGGGIARVAKRGGSARPVAPAQCPFGIASDGVDLFYADFFQTVDAGETVFRTHLHQVPLGGGTDTTFTESPRPVTNVVLDERNVYFGADDGLYRFARKSGASTRLATDGEIKYVAVDDACVYWTNDAALMTLPK